MRDGLRLEKASETGLGKNALILELGKSCKMDRRYPKLNTQWKACFEKLWKFPCLSYYKNKKIKTTHYAEVWKQGHKVRMLQDRRTTFQRKLPWMYLPMHKQSLKENCEKLKLSSRSKQQFLRASFWHFCSRSWFRKRWQAFSFFAVKCWIHNHFKGTLFRHQKRYHCKITVISPNDASFLNIVQNVFSGEESFLLTF